jgi:hypothetical protein
MDEIRIALLVWAVFLGLFAVLMSAYVLYDRRKQRKAREAYRRDQEARKQEWLSWRARDPDGVISLIDRKMRERQ